MPGNGALRRLMIANLSRGTSPVTRVTQGSGRTDSTTGRVLPQGLRLAM